jgi:hypothetical protein
MDSTSTSSVESIPEYDDVADKESAAFQLIQVAFLGVTFAFAVD